MQNFRIMCFIFTCVPMLHYCTGLSQQEQLSQLEPHCPERCSCSRHLKTVSCVGLRLRSIPKDIPRSATQLYLSHNFLTEIGKGAFQTLTNLTFLSLEYNLIDNIDGGAFLGLTKLESLFLRQNQLTRLSSEVFQDLYNLSHMYLSQNKLVNIPDMGYAQNLIYLTIDNNNLNSALFPPGFRSLTRLSTVVLSNNPKLTQIKGVDFAALNHSTVRKIAVSRCNLNDIESGVFNSFPRLQSLVLSYNVGWNESFIRKVLSMLANCSEMTSLDLSGVIRLPALPADIFVNLSSVPLKHLSLAHTTQIAVVDNGTFQYFPMLERLDLSNSEFNIIQDTMSQMKKLKTLKLANNKQLKLVPYLNLPLLEVLDLSFCTSIEDLKEMTFFDLPVLSKLVMRSCVIHQICKDAFRGLDQLKRLDLSHNKVGSSSLPVDSFAPLGQLTELDLSYNNLKQIATERDLFKTLASLTTLDLSGNKCSMIPEDIFDELTSLTSLDLSQNSLGDGVITEASGGKLLRGLNALERVMLMDNDISVLPVGFFDNLLSLQMVNLSGNHLDRWDRSAFNASANLSLIDFSRNKITAVPKQSIVYLRSAVKLNLTDNPFTCWCDLIWFRNWITNNNITDVKLPGLKSYKCSSPVAMANKPLLDFDPQSIASKCSPPPWIIIVVSVGGGVAVVMFTIVAICYKYRWPIRLKMYKVKKRMRRERGYERMHEEADDVYDVYVSYGPSDADEDWVTQTLMPAIDVKERARRALGNAGFLGVNAYWEKRDMIPGTSEIGAIADAIHGSRKVMLIVSPEYVRDGRRAYEIEIAVDKSCRAHLQLADVLIVLLDKDAALRLPTALHRKVEDDALEWTPDDSAGQALFWQRLHDQLHAEIPLQNMI